jgi:Fic family protein
MLSSVAAISEQLGRWSVTEGARLTPQLRRANRIRTIQASLAIEDNTLSVEQIAAVLAGKRVLGLPREIQEVRNAFAAYEQLDTWQPASADDLLAAHGVLMAGLVDRPGRYRTGGVGIYRDQVLLHMAPPARRVPKLVGDLLHWLARTELHALIASCVFHYEFEFIHPFEDGNGRMGRLWQTLILSRWQPVLAWLPVETAIRARQAEYYAALAAADKAAEATPFVLFMLDALRAAMAEATATGSEKGSEKSSEKILSLLRRAPQLSARELAEKLGLTPRAVEKQIAALRKAGRLRRVGPAKGGRWELP